MENKNNENATNDKTKVVSSTSQFNSNIQPRVVLQRLSKDYTVAVPTESDNQPSTSGGVSRGNKNREVDSNASDDTSDSSVNTENDSAVVSTSRATSSGVYPTRKRVIEFQVSPLRIVNYEKLGYLRKRARIAPSSPPTPPPPLPVPLSPTPASPIASHSISGSASASASGSGSECSFNSSPKEVVPLEENRSDTDEIDECTDVEVDKPTSPESTCSEENSVRGINTTEDKIERAISFLKLLIEAYGRRLERNIDQSSTSSSSLSPPPTIRPVTRSIIIRTQQKNLEDCVVRLWLVVRGRNTKKKFHVKLSQLISLVNDKNHPLYKFRESLNLQTLRYLSDGELRVIARVLADFVCAQPVTY